MFTSFQREYVQRKKNKLSWRRQLKCIDKLIEVVELNRKKWVKCRSSTIVEGKRENSIHADESFRLEGMSVASIQEEQTTLVSPFESRLAG